MKTSQAIFAAITALVIGSAAQGYGSNLLLKLQGSNGAFCMDASLDQREQNGDKVYVYKCTGRENQRWAITHDTNGQSALVGLGGYCLDVRGFESSHTGTPVQLWQCHYGKNQRFNVTPTGQIKEVESGKCLIATGVSDRAPVVLDTCMNTPMEKWSFDQ